MILKNLLEEYLLNLDRQATRKTCESILGELVVFLGPEREACLVSRLDILKWKQSQQARTERFVNHPRRPKERGALSPMTIFRNLKTARAFWHWAVEIDEALHQSPMHGMKLKMPPKPSASSKAAPLGTLRALMSVMRASPRDWAMYLFLLDTGCRRGGLCTLTLERLDLESRHAVLIEKGGKEQRVYFTDETARAMRLWLKQRPKVASHTVFLSIRTKDEMRPDSVTMWMRRKCDQAGVTPIGPHAIRHAVGIHLASHCEPLSLIRDLFGHSSALVTAASYMPDSEEEIRAMIERRSLLYEVFGFASAQARA